MFPPRFMMQIESAYIPTALEIMGLSSDAAKFCQFARTVASKLNASWFSISRSHVRTSP